jgi:hypothetical protein
MSDLPSPATELLFYTVFSMSMEQRLADTGHREMTHRLPIGQGL